MSVFYEHICAFVDAAQESSVNFSFDGQKPFLTLRGQEEYEGYSVEKVRDDVKEMFFDLQCQAVQDFSRTQIEFISKFALQPTKYAFDAYGNELRLRMYLDFTSTPLTIKGKFAAQVWRDHVELMQFLGFDLNVPENTLTRYNVGEKCIFVHQEYEYTISNPLKVAPVKIRFLNLFCVWHHWVPSEYDNDLIYHGFRWIDKDGEYWLNQYPIASDARADHWVTREMTLFDDKDNFDSRTYEDLTVVIEKLLYSTAQLENITFDERGKVLAHVQKLKKEALDQLGVVVYIDPDIKIGENGNIEVTNKARVVKLNFLKKD